MGYAIWSPGAFGLLILLALIVVSAVLVPKVRPGRPPEDDRRGQHLNLVRHDTIGVSGTIYLCSRCEA